MFKLNALDTLIYIPIAENYITESISVTMIR